MTALGISGASHSKEQGFVEAQSVLRQVQEEQARQSGAFSIPRPESTTELALQSLQWRKELQPTADPKVVRRGLWKFIRELEEERIRLAEELIRRVDPGPFEDANYLALLAYQAASVEMALGVREGGEHRWSRFLLGTVHSPSVDSFAKVFRQSGYTVVGIHSALIDFTYQAAKAVVAAAHPVRSNDGKSDIQAPLLSAAIELELSRNPEPVQRLYRTLEAYFFGGYPRAFANEQLRPEDAVALSPLVGMSERFIIAHEYGHARSPALDYEVAAKLNPEWLREFNADHYAMVATVWSGKLLDEFNPEVSLAGGVFSLACLDILAQALSILRDGIVRAEDGSKGHPPPRARAEMIVEKFHSAFRVEYRPGFRGCALTPLTDRHEGEKVEESTRRHVLEGSFAYAKALSIVWKRVQTMLRHDYETKRPLHRMWAVKESSS